MTDCMSSQPFTPNLNETAKFAGLLVEQTLKGDPLAYWVIALLGGLLALAATTCYAFGMVVGDVYTLINGRVILWDNEKCEPQAYLRKVGAALKRADDGKMGDGDREIVQHAVDVVSSHDGFRVAKGVAALVQIPSFAIVIYLYFTDPLGALLQVTGISMILSVGLHFNSAVAYLYGLIKRKEVPVGEFEGLVEKDVSLPVKATAQPLLFLWPEGSSKPVGCFVLFSDTQGGRTTYYIEALAHLLRLTATIEYSLQNTSGARLTNSALKALNLQELEWEQRAFAESVRAALPDSVGRNLAAFVAASPAKYPRGVNRARTATIAALPFNIVDGSPVIDAGQRRLTSRSTLLAETTKNELESLLTVELGLGGECPDAEAIKAGVIKHHASTAPGHCGSPLISNGCVIGLHFYTCAGANYAVALGSSGVRNAFDANMAAGLESNEFDGLKFEGAGKFSKKRHKLSEAVRWDGIVNGNRRSMFEDGMSDSESSASSSSGNAAPAAPKAKRARRSRKPAKGGAQASSSASAPPPSDSQKPAKPDLFSRPPSPANGRAPAKMSGSQPAGESDGSLKRQISEMQSALAKLAAAVAERRP